MRYREIQPSPSLSRFIECFWTLERDATIEPAAPERLLPDGCVELILNFGTPFRELHDDGREEPQPRYFLVGQMTRPMLITTDGRVTLIGIRFHPGGTLPFFRTSLSELTNQVVELSALSQSLEQELIPEVGESGSLTRKVAALQRLLTKRVIRKLDVSTRILATRIVACGGQVSVDEIASDAGISSRQLQRKFLQDVGLGPKTLCRILRFQRVFRAVDRNDAGWAAVAADCGYYDQSHLIRDFQQFAGQTPSLLLTQASQLTRSLTRKDRMSHFSNTTAAKVG